MKMMRLALLIHPGGAGPRARIYGLLVVGLLVLPAPAPASLTRAQYCNPAVVSYLVRDERGKVLSGAELQSVSQQLPKAIGEAEVYAGEISLADDGKTVYRNESVEYATGEKRPSLQFINARTCTMRLSEVTLTRLNKKMRLIFGIEITRDQSGRRPVIDSLPFQEGTFALELRGWALERDQVIPASRWKRLKIKRRAD